MPQTSKTLVYAADNDGKVLWVYPDEEMTNMIKFKYAYNARLKTIGVIMRCLIQLIHRTGIFRPVEFTGALLSGLFKDLRRRDQSD